MPEAVSDSPLAWPVPRHCLEVVCDSLGLASYSSTHDSFRLMGSGLLVHKRASLVC